MRKLRTTADLTASKWTKARIEREVRNGAITPIVRGVYGAGSERPTELDRVRATALVTGGVLDSVATAQLYDFDGVRRWRPHVLVARTSSAKREFVRRTTAVPLHELRCQVRCLRAADALRELASVLDDTHWEQALEFCLRTKLVTADEVARWRHPRVRRVVRVRGGLLVPPTESLLETLAVQLFRRDPSIPTPVRQFAVYDEHGTFVGRPDLCWPALGVFLELDGQQHIGQPVYDAVRQTNITAATGWRCGRLTGDEVHEWPESTLRRIANLVRPLSKVS